MIRFGNGTEVSKDKAQRAIDLLWRYTDELFETHASYDDLIGSGVYANPETLKKSWTQKIDEVFFLAHLSKPENRSFQLTGAKHGTHSEYMGYILAEMQFLPNKYPEARW